MPQITQIYTDSLSQIKLRLTLIIGTALEGFAGTGSSTEGLVSMFINPDYKTTFDESTFGLITDGQIATNAAISDTKLATITTPGKIAVTALPVEVALLQGETQTFTGNYIFGQSELTEDLLVINSRLASDLKFAVDGLYNIGSASATAANIYASQLNAGKLVVAANNDWQNINTDDYGLYLSASSGLAYFGDSVIIGDVETQNRASLPVVTPTYPDFVVNGGDLLVVDDLGIGSDLYVQGNIRVAGTLEYQGTGIAHYFAVDSLSTGTIESGMVVVISQSTSSQGAIAASANARNILGVVGTGSAAVFGANDMVETQNLASLPVVTAGITLVNVPAENGAISQGDQLTTAGTAGRAMKASKIGAGVLGVALEDLAAGEGAIKVLVNLGTYYEPAAQVITVAKAGGDYKTITQALNSISDNSSANKYIIEVGPGVYEESVNLKSFVDLVGASQNQTTILSPVSPVISLDGNSRLEGLTIESTATVTEPVLIGVNGLGSTTEPVLTNLHLLAESDHPAIGLSLIGSAEKVTLTNADFGANFYQGIANLASTTLVIMNSDLSQINGTALVAQNGLTKSYRNQFKGLLGDIYVSTLARVESANDYYKNVNNFGVFLDVSNRHKVAHAYIDYGWLTQADVASSSIASVLRVTVGAGQGYIAGVKVNTAEISNVEVLASSTNYIFMTEFGQTLVATSTDIGTSTAAILVAQVEADQTAVISVINERTNEIIVAKEGGQFRTITEALDSITTNSAQNRWTVSLKPGVYHEQVNLKPFVDIMGSGENTVIMSVNQPVLIGGATLDGGMASSQPATLVKDLKLSLTNDSIGQPVVLASSSHVILEEVAINWSGTAGLESTGVKVAGEANVLIKNSKINDAAYGVSSEILSDASATSTVDISFSSISSQLADIRAVCVDAATGEACSAELIIDHQALISNINSSYNTLSGGGTNFEVGRHTVISSAHDTYLNYEGEGEFRQRDYFRNQTNAGSILFSLQNAGFDLFSVSASGTVAVSPQNTSGDSFTITSPTASSTLTVINSGAGVAITTVGDLVLTPATSTMPVTLSSAGAQLNLGRVGDTINLNVEGVTYNFKENVRRNVLSAYLPAPVSGDKIWGSGDQSWSPPEDITVLAVKAQYSCTGGGVLQLVLKDQNNNALAQLDGLSCNEGYTELVAADLNYLLTLDQGMYVDVITATEGVTNVTVTVEYVYQNR